MESSAWLRWFLKFHLTRFPFLFACQLLLITHANANPENRVTWDALTWVCMLGLSTSLGEVKACNANIINFWQYELHNSRCGFVAKCGQIVSWTDCIPMCCQQQKFKVKVRKCHAESLRFGSEMQSMLHGSRHCFGARTTSDSGNCSQLQCNLPFVTGWDKIITPIWEAVLARVIACCAQASQSVAPSRAVETELGSSFKFVSVLPVRRHNILTIWTCACPPPVIQWVSSLIRRIQNVFGPLLLSFTLCAKLLAASILKSTRDECIKTRATYFSASFASKLCWSGIAGAVSPAVNWNSGSSMTYISPGFGFLWSTAGVPDGFHCVLHLYFNSQSI